jgi:hypothetical protein
LLYDLCIQPVYIGFYNTACKVFWTMKNQRRMGELITICCGIGLAVGGLFVNVPPVAYGGLCIMGLGVISVFWR